MISNFKQHSKSYCGVTLFLLVAMAATGCGPSGPQRYSVEGTVSFNGVPVERGEVIFFSTGEDGSSDAGPIENGKFQFKAFPGEKRVEITATRAHATKSISGIEPGTKIPVLEQYLPARYNKKSELTAAVDPAGDRTYQFDLTAD